MLIITRKLADGLLLDIATAGPVEVKILRHRGDTITLALTGANVFQLLPADLVSAGARRQIGVNHVVDEKFISQSNRAHRDGNRGRDDQRKLG